MALVIALHFGTRWEKRAGDPASAAGPDTRSIAAVRCVCGMKI